MAACTPRTRRQSGFTLIELLVAVSLLAIISIMAWQGLNQILIGRRHITASMQEERNLQLAFEQLRQDLSHAAIDTRLSQPVLHIHGDMLTLTRWTSMPDAPPQLWQIDYSIRQGRLLREARRINPGHLNRNDNRIPGMQRQLWLQGIDSISAHLYRPGFGWTGLSMGPDWPAGQPRLLKLQITWPVWPYPVSRIYRIGP